MSLRIYDNNVEAVKAWFQVFAKDKKRYTYEVVDKLGIDDILEKNKAKKNYAFIVDTDTIPEDYMENGQIANFKNTISVYFKSETTNIKHLLLDYLKNKYEFNYVRKSTLMAATFIGLQTLEDNLLLINIEVK